MFNRMILHVLFAVQKVTAAFKVLYMLLCVMTLLHIHCIEAEKIDISGNKNNL